MSGAMSDLTVSEVAHLMLHHKIDSLPVVSGGGLLVGLVTSSDLLQLLVESGRVEALPFHYELRMTECPGVEAD